MVDAITKFCLSIAATFGIKTAGKLLPVTYLGPFQIVTAGYGAYKTLVALDDAMKQQVLSDVKSANHIKPGVGNDIVLCEIVGEKFEGWEGKKFLETAVKNIGGGTAWYQSSHGRMECFWINDVNFVPKSVSGDEGSSIGHIVHGAKNFQAEVPSKK